MPQEDQDDIEQSTLEKAKDKVFQRTRTGSLPFDFSPSTILSASTASRPKRPRMTSRIDVANDSIQAHAFVLNVSERTVLGITASSY